MSRAAKWTAVPLTAHTKEVHSADWPSPTAIHAAEQRQCSICMSINTAHHLHIHMESVRKGKREKGKDSMQHDKSLNESRGEASSFTWNL